MATPSEYDPYALEQSARAAREKLEALLPDQPNLTYETGWVEPVFLGANVYPRSPRRRGSLVTHLAHKALRRSDEGYSVASRSAQVGQLPEDWWGWRMPPRLAIFDKLYTPIDPVDDNIAPIRHTTALFITTAGGDAEGYLYERGLSVRFLEREKLTFDIATHGSGSSIETLQTYLAEHNLPLLYTDESHKQVVKLVDFCISTALADESNTK